MYLVESIQPWSIRIASASINYPASALSPIGFSPGAEGRGGRREPEKVGKGDSWFKKTPLHIFFFPVIMFCLFMRCIIPCLFFGGSYTRVMFTFFQQMLDNTENIIRKNTFLPSRNTRFVSFHLPVIMCHGMPGSPLSLSPSLSKRSGSFPSKWPEHVPGCGGQDPQDTEEKHCREWRWEASIHVSMDYMQFTQA